MKACYFAISGSNRVVFLCGALLALLGGCRDLASYSHVKAPDLAIDALADGSRIEGPSPEARPCAVPPLTNATAATCSEQCVDPVGDTDCDGLVDGQDPDGARCNSLLLSDPMEEDPNTSTRWVVGGEVRWKCGKLAMAAGSRLTLADAAQLAPASSYLVEARVTLGAVADESLDGWAVALRVGLTTGVEYNCEIWTSAQYGKAFPSAHLNQKNTCGDSGTFPLAPNPNPGLAGETYVIQLWHDLAKTHCRILEGDGMVYHYLATYPGCPYPAPDTFYLRNRNIATTLDYVRVFAIDG